MTRGMNLDTTSVRSESERESWRISLPAPPGCRALVQDLTEHWCHIPVNISYSTANCRMPANATCSSLDGLPWRPDRRRLAWGVRPALVGADDAPLCRQMMPLLGGALVIHGAMFSWTRYAQDQMRVGGDRDIPLAVPIGQVMFAGSGASSLISPTLAKHPNHRSKFQLRPNVFSALLTALQTARTRVYEDATS